MHLTLISNIKIELQIAVLLLKLIIHTFAHEGNLRRLSIIGPAVIEDQLNIIQEVLDLSVVIILKVVFHSRQVHWSFDDV